MAIGFKKSITVSCFSKDHYKSFFSFWLNSLTITKVFGVWNKNLITHNDIERYEMDGRMPLFRVGPLSIARQLDRG